MRTNNTIKVDTFDMIQAILRLKKSSDCANKEYELLMECYEKSLKDDIRRKKYSSKIFVPIQIKNIIDNSL